MGSFIIIFIILLIYFIINKFNKHNKEKEKTLYKKIYLLMKLEKDNNKNQSQEKKAETIPNKINLPQSQQKNLVLKKKKLISLKNINNKGKILLR